MKLFGNKPAWTAGVLLAVIFALVWLARSRHEDGSVDRGGGARPPVPIEVADVVRGPFALHRTFSGTLEAHARFVVAPKVSGRVQKLYVDVADHVSRAQLVAQVDDAEFKQAVAEAEARMAVAAANLTEAESRLAIARRALDRTDALQKRGIASESVLDSAQAEFLASQAGLEVARSGLKREEAAVAAARIRLGYTRILADWDQGDNERIVAERFVDEGNTVAANTPLISIVELDPALAVIQVTERDYPRIETGRTVALTTDAFPNQVFTGTVARIAPVFRAASRQARVEVTVPNPDHRLKPGMFARCTLELERVADAIVVPDLAITMRNDATGLFELSPDGKTVRWVTVELGLREGDRVQIRGANLSGPVVTMGQQLLKDGAAVSIPGRSSPGDEAQPEQ